MNGSDNNYQPSPDLPAPQQESTNPLAAERPKAAEVAGLAAEQPGSAMPTPPVPTPQNPIAPPAAVAPSSAPMPTPIPVNDAPINADDSDLIEKEWVAKAKYIVESTKEDPHRQNQEMNKIKADYIQKRYNKQLKVNED